MSQEKINIRKRRKMVKLEKMLGEPQIYTCKSGGKAHFVKDDRLVGFCPYMHESETKSVDCMYIGSFIDGMAACNNSYSKNVDVVVRKLKC